MRPGIVDLESFEPLEKPMQRGDRLQPDAGVLAGGVLSKLDRFRHAE